jgi:hypothetical protein
MDLFYLENMSILLDLKIMLKTGAVIAGQLLESRQPAQRDRVGAKRTKLEGDFAVRPHLRSWRARFF